MTILVVGDAMVDRYWLGKSTRPCPDGPEPLVRVDSTTELPGGAANVEANLAMLGADTVLVSGGSNSGEYLTKNRVVDCNRVVCRFDEGDYLQPLPLTWDLDKLAHQHRNCDAIVVADYGKGTVTDAVASWIRDFKKPTYVDCKVRPDRWVDWATAMFPNAQEHLKNLEDYARAERVMVKKGPLGCTFRSGKEVRGFPSRAREVVNATGAGDTAVAAFVVAITAFGPDYFHWACEFAMEAAALSVEALLTHAPTIKNVVKEFNSEVARKLVKVEVSN